MKAALVRALGGPLVAVQRPGGRVRRPSQSGPAKGGTAYAGAVTGRAADMRRTTYFDAGVRPDEAWGRVGCRWGRLPYRSCLMLFGMAALEN